jgi:hypothetical protein
MTTLSQTRGRQTLGVILRLLGASAIALGSGCTRGAPPEPGEHVGVTDQHLTAAQCDYFDVNGKDQICHATGSASHPYTIIKTSEQGCINGHVGHPGDYITSTDPHSPTYDPTCQHQGCLPQGAPWDPTLPCCDGLAPSAGVCQPTSVNLCANVTCSASDQCHTAGTCDPGTGVCSNPAKADGSACDDGNANTTGDVCTGGVCAGVDHCAGVTCAAQDQCHVAGTCDHATGVCSNPAKADGSACDDGNANSVSDVCTGGACAGVDHCIGVTCTAQDQCHVAGTCDHATGACSNPDAANGSSCDDGNANTVGDVCTNGSCAGVDHCIGVTCAAQDQCHVAGTCDHATGACSNPAKANGSACDDGNAQTTNDVCTGGVCAGVSLCAGVVCAAQDQCHTAGTCDPNTGHCSNPPAANGTACDDGSAQTTNDVCTGGVCAGVSLCAGVVCAAQDQCHTAGTCDPNTGQCSNPAAANGTACNDGNACTQTDTCQNGACTGANPVVCAAAGPCHDAGTCDPSTGACSNPASADGTACDDGNACTENDSCQAGACVPGSARTCPAEVCQTSTCNPLTGQCSDPTPDSDGTACDDGDFCTKNDTCHNGCSATGLTFTYLAADCGDSDAVLRLSINDDLDNAVLIVVPNDPYCDISAATPQTVSIDDPAVLALVTGCNDKFEVTSAGTGMVFGFAQVDVTYTLGSASSVCIYDAAGGNCATRYGFDDGYEYDPNPQAAFGDCSGTCNQLACGGTNTCTSACATNAYPACAPGCNFVVQSTQYTCAHIPCNNFGCFVQMCVEFDVNYCGVCNCQ